MHNFKELKVWNKSVELSLEIYRISMGFPAEEKFGLTSQIRRCSVSIPSNIAEGTGRKTPKDFYSFLSNALASSFELETQLIIACRLNMITDPQHENISSQVREVQKMIIGLQRSLNI
ncbi:MAG: four helix bundle protein [Bacteroidota bacterium]